MFETLATFHLLMSALNAVAPENACEQSRALKEPAPHQPRAPTSVQRMVHATSSGQSACRGTCWHSTIEMQRNCGGWAGAGWKESPCCLRTTEYAGEYTRRKE
jgi:hypothetical protein